VPATVRENAPEPEASAERKDVAGDISTGATAQSGVAPLSLEPSAQPPAHPIALASAGPSMERLQAAVLQALTDGNQRILVSMLEAGEWSVQANELVIKISESQTVIDMSVGPEARRLAIASASGVLGRAVKLKIIPGTPLNGKGDGGNVPAAASGSKIGGRSRAEQDPLVQRMRERFGAEIRTVIDYRDKR
jgi:DNA polymerase-3 subunit gamma/tau